LLQFVSVGGAGAYETEAMGLPKAVHAPVGGIIVPPSLQSGSVNVTTVPPQFPVAWQAGVGQVGTAVSAIVYAFEKTLPLGQAWLPAAMMHGSRSPKLWVQGPSLHAFAAEQSWVLATYEGRVVVGVVQARTSVGVKETCPIGSPNGSV
jgi:hypothetical protein